MTDPAQLLKNQLGELVWNNAALVARVQELEKINEELNIQIKEYEKKETKDA